MDLKSYSLNTHSFFSLVQVTKYYIRLTIITRIAKSVMAKRIAHFSLLSLALCCLAFAYEPLQDFCVADPNSSIFVNGKACKNPKQIQANDFYFSGLHLSGNTSNPYGLMVQPVTVAELPGLNTLGISMVRIDYAPWGINPPHTHPRATEIITVLEGTIQVGFVTSVPEYRLVTKILYKGDVFVFPVGLVHFQQNVGNESAVVIGALSSQNPGVVTVGNAVFGSNPRMSSELLAKAFQVDMKVVDQIKEKF